MEVFLTTLFECLAELAATVVIMGLGILGSWVLSKLNKTKELQNITLATEQVFSAAKSTVSELQQTLVEGWKRAQDGKLTEEQVEELRAQVLEITLNKLSDPTINLLQSAKIDVIAMIVSAAESYVLEMKKGGV